jgi:Skp family chaperone for outer membrane proteins
MKRFVMAGAVVAAALGLAERKAEGSRIVVVDMSRLVSQHRQSRDEQQLIEQWKDATEKLHDESVKKYRAQVDELDQFKPGSDEHRKRSNELRVRKFELENEANSLGEEFQLRVAKSLSDSHARVAAACRTYLEANDLDAVLQYASTPVGGTKSSEVIPEIVVRTVVAYRKTSDATDAILAILDAGK